jgi:hypothetical protein
VPEVAHYDSSSRLSRPSDSPLNTPFGIQGPFQHTLGGGVRQRRAPIGAVLFGAVGVIAAVAAIIWTTLQTAPNQLVSTPGVTAATNGAPGVKNAGNPAERVSFDGLPTETDLAELPAKTAGHPPAPRAPYAARVRPPSDAAAELAERRGVKGEKVTLEESATTPQPEAVTLDDQDPPAPPKQPEAPPEDRGPLNRGAALSALATAGGRARACGEEGGPVGSGRAMVTFSPEGPVSNVTVPAPFAGTSVGTCIATAFRAARVPAFTGSAVTLPGSFRIQ